jgi:GAF domain-containing protein
LILVGIAIKNANLYQETYSMVQENKRLYEKSAMEAKKTKLLLQLAQQLNVEENVDSLITSILSLAKTLMNADSTSLFLVDHSKQELYSKLFNGHSDSKISFPIGKGVAGSVAQSGVLANIPDAYQDARFNPEMDKRNNYHTKSMLVCPIFGPDNRIIGVANLINKIDIDTKQVIIFSTEDEELFLTFSSFCGVALHKAMLFDEIKTQKQRLSIVMELMCFHAQTSKEEAEQFLESEDQHFIPNHELASYLFDPHRFDNTSEVLVAITHQMFMIQGYDKGYEIPDLKLVDYILTVRSNYRPVAYHNFTHAVSVTHSLYVMIVNGMLDNYMDRLEMFSMFVAALNHDIDHRGTNNAFQQKTGSVLANFYGASTMERHHFNHAMTILNSNSGLNILEQLSTANYKRCLELIEQCILATDLTAFFPTRKQLLAILEKDGFDRKSKHHMSLLRGVLMNCADLGAMYKPFESCVHTANYVYEEFFQQGDKEKEMGMPYSSELTDRSKKSEIPRMQVGFFNFVVIPAFECLYKVMGEPTKHLLDAVLKNRDEWDKLQEGGTPYGYESSAVSVRRPRSSTRDSFRGTTIQLECSITKDPSVIMEIQ